MTQIVRIQPKRAYTVGLVAVASAIALFVSGCSDSSDDTAAPSNTATDSSTGTDAAPSASAGASSAAVDGKALDAKFDATCAKQGDTLALALVDADNAIYGNLAVSAAIAGTDTVQAVGIGGTKGGANGQPYALGFGQGMPGGSAKVVKDGQTYKVTGEGVAMPDMSNPTAPQSVPFSITFACSTIVGG